MATSKLPQKHLLTIIRDFSTEKSQGERRLVGLNKRLQEVQAELVEENAKLENIKRMKETTEKELKGYEVELALKDASIQALEARCSQLHDEISVAGSKLEALKVQEGASRDEFIHQMSELNSKIRKFQERVSFHLENQTKASSGQDPSIEDPVEVDLKALQNMLGILVSKTEVEEKAYEVELNLFNQVKQNLADSEKKLSLMEAIMKETEELQGLTEYP